MPISRQEFQTLSEDRQRPRPKETIVEGHPKKCPLIPNWSTRKDRTCRRICTRRGDPKCPART